MKKELVEINDIEKALKISLKPRNPESSFSEMLKSRLKKPGEISIEKNNLLLIQLIILTFLIGGLLILFLIKLIPKNKN